MTQQQTPADPRLSGLAGQLSRTALENVVREFPYYPAHVVTGPADVVLPRVLHPVFYGAYDWHSAVHMHWLLVRLLRTQPDVLDSSAVRRLLHGQLTPAALEAEARYLRADPSFERPYGWAWLLTLAAECASWQGDRDAGTWTDALRPCTDAVVDLVLDWLPRARLPVREGGHANTAFSLGLVLDAAVPLALPQLAEAVRTWAEAAYLGDRDAPAAWEPSGQDFLSPALAEADLVRRLLPPAPYAEWLRGFLPDLADGGPVSLLVPVEVADRTDGLLGHLDGLNFSRAAMLGSVARALPPEDPRLDVLLAGAERHLEAALPALSGPGYLSSHWLGSFAVLAMSGW